MVASSPVNIFALLSSRQHRIFAAVMIDKQTIARILDTARIEEVVGEFVKLKKSGASYKGLSPFTDERNPSFFVIPAKGIYKCFSSGKGGNAVNFLMEYEHLTYPEALRYLAKKYGIPIQEEEARPEDTEAQNEREALFLVNAFAQKFFSDQLFETEKGKAIGLEYFKDREFKIDTIKKFQLGFSPEGWDAFTKHALDSGYKKEYLEKTGLTIVREDKMYDRFRARVIFPIHNATGRVLGFGGRTLSKEDNIPKYVNSPESDIYNKSQILYGLFFAKNAIIRADNCYLVEGYTDVISMHQAGIENVVASSGTSLTTEQVKLIKRYTQNITILYDGDPAGIKASFRGIDMVLEEGMNVRIVLFPDNEDPDSYARKYRRQELEDLITGQANDFIRFKTGLLLKEAAGDPIKRAVLIKEIVGSISLIPDQIYRSVYIKECSSLMEVPEQALMNELNKILRQRSMKQAQEVAATQEVEIVEYPARKQIRETQGDSEFQERDLIRMLLMYGLNDLVFLEQDEDGRPVEHRITVGHYITGEILNDDIHFRNPVYQKIFDEYNEQLLQEAAPDEQLFINHPDEHVVSAVIDLLSSPYELSENWLKHRIIILTEKEKLRQAVEGTVLSFKSKTIRQMINDLQKEIKEVKYDDRMMELLSRLKDLKDISQKINALLGRVVTN
jgi:DNA primase